VNLILPGDPYIRSMFADEEPIRAAYWQPQAGDTVIDIGSHHGSYSLPALAAGADVIAVEPYREHSDTMLALAQLNGISTVRLTVISEPLAGPDGYTEEFWQFLAAAPWQTIYATRDMPFTTLDELVARLNLTRLDWVKMDAEGAELSILQGGTETLARFRPFLLIEDHSEVYSFVAAMDSPRLCLELLRGLGYDPEIVRHAPATDSPDRDYWVCRPGCRN